MYTGLNSNDRKTIKTPLLENRRRRRRVGAKPDRRSFPRIRPRGLMIAL